MIKDAYSIDFKIFKKLEHFKKKKHLGFPGGSDGKKSTCIIYAIL